MNGLAPGVRLGYCTNVHPYQDVDGMLTALRDAAVPLRQRLVARGELAADEPLGVGLWFPAGVARELARDASTLRETLAGWQLDAFTVNAFPYGSFHGDVVKDDVFRPAWGDPERLEYTLDASRALAALIDEGEVGSVSTHTGAYKAWGLPDTDPARIAAGLLAAADGLAQLERDTGRRIVLGLEPEPLSFLETTDEVLAFFGDHLLGAGDAARRHLGLCYDACHQAVEFEDMAASVSALATAGIPLAKVQLSSAFRLPDPRAARELLRPFAEDRWFHQVVLRHTDGSLERIADLPQALADERAVDAAEWRVHYHVPVFADALDDEGDGGRPPRLFTTRPQLEELLSLLADGRQATHLEIETYTWHAIPAERRRALGVESVVDCLEAEFRWVLGQLRGNG